MKVSRVVTAGVAAVAACGAWGMVPPAVQASSASIPAWTKQAPPARPPARAFMAMAYDAANRTVVQFGGDNFLRYFADTWTWG